MSPSDFGFWAAAAGYLAAAGLHWRAMPRGGPSLREEHLLLAALACTAVWALAELVHAARPTGYWLAAIAGLDLLRYALWIGLLLALTGRSTTPAIRRGSIIVFVSLILATGVMATRHWAAGGVDAPPSRLLLLAWLALAIGGLYLVERLVRTLSEDSRWGPKPLVLALLLVFSFDAYIASEALLLVRSNPQTDAVRGGIHALAAPVLMLLSLRRGDWMSRLRFSHVAAFHSVTLLVAGSFMLMLSGVGYYVRAFGGTWDHTLQVALGFATAALLLTLGFSGTLRSRVRVFLGKHFFRYRFDYREQWLRFTSELSAAATSSELDERIVRALADVVECSAGSLWLRSRTEGPFRLAARWNMPADQAEEPADGSLARWLEQRNWVVDLQEFRLKPRAYEGFAMPSWLLATKDAWLLVPLIAGDRLQGFVVLARPRARLEIDWEVLDLLKTAGRQAAGYLAQMQATEALLEARKFDAFNRMSAFVVHDLKNIVTQLSLMLKNAERLHDNPEFQRDMLLTVESSLEKMRRLMLQLREGEAPAGISLGVELSTLAERLGRMAARQQRRLEIDVPPGLATRGHEDRLERVLGHVVQNALDATPASGRVWLKAGRNAGQVRIEVGDTGAGMSEEFVRTRLFTPFSSTKPSGMGVGAFESAQYVRELGGSIDVESAQGVGTVFTITLPVFENR